MSVLLCAGYGSDRSTRSIEMPFYRKNVNYTFSDLDFPENRIWVHVQMSEIVWKICTFVPLIIFGLYGNFIIVYLIARNRALRTPTNLIIANMAVADFLTLLICPSMFMINDFYQNYQLGTIGCKLEGFLVVLFLVTGVFNLSLVSYDRLIAIVLPMEKRLDMRCAKFVIAATWIAGICFAMPLAIYRNYKVRIWKNLIETYCKENTTILPKYWYVLITIMVWLPLGIMLICYSAIFYKIDRYEKRVLKRENPIVVNYKKSVAKTLFIIVIVFAVLRLPFTILVVMRDEFAAKDSEVNRGMQQFWYISQYLMFLNSAVNPVIYGYNNDNFKRAYAQSRSSCYCCSSCKDTRTTSPKSKAKSTTKPSEPHYCSYCAFMKRKRYSDNIPGCMISCNLHATPIGELAHTQHEDL